MSNPNPVPPTTSTPWYKSDILRGILVAIVSQLIAHSKLANILSNDQVGAIVNYIMEGISAGAIFWATHARLTKPTLPITGTKLDVATKAAIANSNVPTPIVVPVAVPVIVTEGKSDAKAINPDGSNHA